MSDATRASPESVSALPPGTRLAEFEIKRLLGIGGFGIVYLAFDHALEREVAIKEYMPASMAGRTETMHVSIRSQSDAEVFELGRRSFVNEAKLLARFDHPSLIKVHRFWEANGTAYMAMPVLRGRTMKDIRKSTQRAPDEAWLRTTMVPLLGALEVLHREGVFHRDIAPDNITIEPDGHPVLLDFGAARRVISDKTQTLTAILKPAYAPIEQYAEAGSVKQGPWTDLYALGATLHFMLLGHPPAPATARAVSDDSAKLGGQNLPGCTPGFLGVIDWMLAPRPNERPQSVAELRAVLEGQATLPARNAPAAASVAAPWEKTVMAAAPALRDAGAHQGVDLGLTRHAGTSPMRTANDDAPRALPQTLAQAEHAGLAAEQGQPLRPPAARSKLLPLALVGLALVAVAGYAGFAFRSSSTAPSATSAATATVASPALAPVPARASLTAPVTAAPVAPAPAAPLATAESSPPAAAAPVAPPVQAAAAAAATTAMPARATRPPAALPHTAGGGATPATPGGAEHAGSRTTTSTTSTTSTAPGAAATPTNQSGASPSAQGAGNAAGAAAMNQSATGAGAVPAGQSPAAAAAASSSLSGPGATPDARCGGRNPLSYFVCMERECLRSAFRNHPECERWRTQARQREGN